MPDLPLLCRGCSRAISPEFLFCPYCGKKLKEKPLPVSVLAQLGIYLLSILLPPLGLWPGVKYVQAEGKKAKLIGTAAIILTLISTLITFWYSYVLLGQLAQPLSGLGF